MKVLRQSAEPAKAEIKSAEFGSQRTKNKSTTESDNENCSHPRTDRSHQVNKQALLRQFETQTIRINENSIDIHIACRKAAFPDNPPPWFDSKFLKAGWPVIANSFSSLC